MEVLVIVSSALYIFGGLLALVNTGKMTGYTLGMIGLLLIVIGIFTINNLLKNSTNEIIGELHSLINL